MSTDLIGLLRAALPSGEGSVAVACSGGRDSVALLHATASAARDVPGLAVVALHVHHGLSSQADAWATHVVSLCEAWAAQGWPVRALVRRVHCPQDGRSVEAVAREARYEALAEMAAEAGVRTVLLAHHRRDQAETFLLQALRGAGVAGLAAMPSQAGRGGLSWCRPWLRAPREAIEAHVAAHVLVFVDDDSNADVRFARNRLRHGVWSSLAAAFPQAEQALADAAARLADAQTVLDAAMAGQVSALCGGCEPGPEVTLDVGAWARLDGPHRRLSLMHWYRATAGQALPASWVSRLADELPAVAARTEPASWPPVGLGLYRGRLRWTPDMAARVQRLRETEQAAQDARQMPAGDWFGDGSVDVSVAEGEVISLTEQDHCRPAGWGGELVAELVEEGGVPRALLASLRLCPRAGGEQFQLGPNRPARLLRKQYQQQGVPAWLRDGPLAWAGDHLVFVPGLGMDARLWAAPGEPQWALRWCPDRVDSGLKSRV
ncbi:tRNA lysidine(34) synthetase TilS [Aquabacterium sp.]|uniref:tRNA lysidine(34) synthetase TilS n=1 Tax=Aquabacterium sp. TaxID=1872578 RepID=UPI0025C1A1EC|nr:tRNA lysidine(34) synthetase TilS [Aquabacterium sp.]